MKSKTMCLGLAALILLLLGEVPALAADGLYSAVTADGVELKLRRYRPTVDADFNVDRQPVLLFSAIVCNMDEYLAHTPPAFKERYADLQLEEPLAEWAQGDEYIAADPLRYFSIAHYLWLQGYDPWLANYRGTGRNEYASQEGSILTTIDVWATLDAPALVDKVCAETGQATFIGGHSTGGLVSYGYLQGASMDVDELAAALPEGYIPHVFSDPDAAAERNAKVKGFIGLDPADIPPLPPYMDLDPLWGILGMPLYIDFDNLIANVLTPMMLNLPPMGDALAMLLDVIFLLDETLGDYIDLFGYVLAMNPDNLHPYVSEYFILHGVSSTYLRAFAQYYDLGMNMVLREHWKNGAENAQRLDGPPRAAGDGYYYYDDNMPLMKVPALAFFSYYDSLVSADYMVRDLMEGKTFNERDEWYIVPDSSHAEVPFGLNAPTFVFPRLGTWLDNVCSDQGNQEMPGGDPAVQPEETGGATTMLVPDSDNGGLCLIGSARH